MGFFDGCCGSYKYHMVAHFDLRIAPGNDKAFSPDHRSHHTGITLMKTSELRVLLAAAQAGATLESHVVHGPATIFVIEGMLEIETQERAIRARHGDLVVLPRDEPRRISSLAQSTFLLALSPAAPAVAAS